MKPQFCSSACGMSQQSIAGIAAELSTALEYCTYLNDSSILIVLVYLICFHHDCLSMCQSHFEQNCVERSANHFYKQAYLSFAQTPPPAFSPPPPGPCPPTCPHAASISTPCTSCMITCDYITHSTAQHPCPAYPLLGFPPCTRK